jgi:hypothetical protein
MKKQNEPKPEDRFGDTDLDFIEVIPPKKTGEQSDKET